MTKPDQNLDLKQNLTKPDQNLDPKQNLPKPDQNLEPKQNLTTPGQNLMDTKQHLAKHEPESDGHQAASSKNTS